MTINKKQIQYLKGVAHPLKPIVLLGNNGLTEAVVAEINKGTSNFKALYDWKSYTGIKKSSG